MQLDAGYDSQQTRDLLEELGCEAHITTKGIPAPIQNTARLGALEQDNPSSWGRRATLLLRTHPMTDRRLAAVEATLTRNNLGRSAS